MFFYMFENVFGMGMVDCRGSIYCNFSFESSLYDFLVYFVDFEDHFHFIEIFENVLGMRMCDIMASS